MFLDNKKRWLTLLEKSVVVFTEMQPSSGILLFLYQMRASKTEEHFVQGRFKNDCPTQNATFLYVAYHRYVESKKAKSALEEIICLRCI